MGNGEGGNQEWIAISVKGGEKYNFQPHYPFSPGATWSYKEIGNSGLF